MQSQSLPMKIVEIFFNRIYFGLYYPWHFMDEILYGDSFDMIVKMVRHRLSLPVEEKKIKSDKQFPKQLSDFFSMQLANLLVGITMYLPVAILLNETILPMNLLSLILLWGGLFVLYLYLTYVLYSKNDKKIKYIAEFLKEPSWKKWSWSIISHTVIVMVWGVTIILFKTNRGTI